MFQTTGQGLPEERKVFLRDELSVMERPGETQSVAHLRQNT
jgi:hypothetical protein